MAFAKISPNNARDLNIAVPFSPLGSDVPSPFRIAPEGIGFLRALDCLASALLYEAGDDRAGQAAVAQVVLNRVRHPAFPHSICGVIYQGSERATGCQFTFTCDGALGRKVSPDAWRQARATASAFLNGETYPAVGMATHYHTNGVHPYWSPTLDKIAQVDTHLFFRWPGGWGRRSAFSSPYTSHEPAEAKLAFLSPVHDQSAIDSPPIAKSFPANIAPSVSVDLLGKRDGDHFIVVDGGGDGVDLAMLGLRECHKQAYCKIVGWDRRSRDHGAPLNPVLGTVAFLYISDERTGVEIVLWDCARFNRPFDSQCLSSTNRRWITFQGSLSRAY